MPKHFGNWRCQRSKGSASGSTTVTHLQRAGKRADGPPLPHAHLVGCPDSPSRVLLSFLHLGKQGGHGQSRGTREPDGWSAELRGVGEPQSRLAAGLGCPSAFCMQPHNVRAAVFLILLLFPLSS